MKQIMPIRLLLIEDNPADVVLTQKAFSKSKINYIIDCAEDGDVALKMLKQVGAYKDFILPHLILLDLNMPKKDGPEFIRDIKIHKHIANIPIIILSGSRDMAEKLFHEDDNVNGYIVKAESQKQYKEIVTEIEDMVTAAIA